jgi:adenosine deaminase
VNENFIAIQEALALTEAEIAALARNSFIASFMTDAEKAGHWRPSVRFMRSGEDVRAPGRVG